VELPEKVINEAEADFSEAEVGNSYVITPFRLTSSPKADFYKALETASQIEFNEYVKV